LEIESSSDAAASTVDSGKTPSIETAIAVVNASDVTFLFNFFPLDIIHFPFFFMFSLLLSFTSCNDIKRLIKILYTP